MKLIASLLVVLVHIYRWTLSPARMVLFGPYARCRFTPSCSEYAIVALRRHGAARGTWMAIRRICRCHPWGGCGEDPVPGVEVHKSMKRKAHFLEANPRDQKPDMMRPTAAH